MYQLYEYRWNGDLGWELVGHWKFDYRTDAEAKFQRGCKSMGLRSSEAPTVTEGRVLDYATSERGALLLVAF